MNVLPETVPEMKIKAVSPSVPFTVTTKEVQAEHVLEAKVWFVTGPAVRDAAFEAVAAAAKAVALSPSNGLAPNWVTLMTGPVEVPLPPLDHEVQTPLLPVAQVLRVVCIRL